MNRIPLIIDTDPGHDDVVAIILALSSPCIDVKAITTVHGNQTLDKTTANALRLRDFIRCDVPIAMGAAHPMISPARTARGHGVTGLDGSTMPAPKSSPSDLSAVETMAKIVQESPEPVTMCVLGPCMNIAAFILAYPHLVPKIKRLSIMGGGFFRGNATPAAEMNFVSDELSAAIVFKSGIPITLFALDITLKTGMTPSDVDKLGNQKDPLSQEIHRLMLFYQSQHRKLGRDMVPVHDACTVAWLINPDLFETRSATIQIDYHGRYTKGATIIDFSGRTGKEPNTLFAVNSKREEIISMILDGIRRIGETI